MSRCCALFLLGLAALSAPAAAGPYLITDLNTGRSTVGPEPAAGLGGVELAGFLYFSADDGMHGHELWRTDGTSEGTELVSDICPGPCSSGPGHLTAFGDLIGFSATDEVHGHELWVTDGTRAGTRMPRDLCSGLCPAVGGLTAVGDRLFFVTQGGASERLAVTDGTTAGTRIVLTPEAYKLVRPIGEIQGRLAFIGPGTTYFSALWWSDGTPQGTSLALDLCASADCSKSWSNPRIVGDRIVFWDQPYGQEVWSSDGTAGGTRKIGDAYMPGLIDVVVWKGSLYFATTDGFWRSDGTPEGTQRLRSFTGWETRARSPDPLGDVLLFLAGDPAQGVTLWQTRGTPESTRFVSDPVPDDTLPQNGSLTRVGNRAFFPVVWGDRSEVWETDGTASGTGRLATICGGGGPRCLPYGTAPAYPTAVGDVYLFGLAEETYGFELWTADEAGPRLVRDIQRNAGSSRYRSSFVVYGEPPPPMRDLAALGSRLVFSARTESTGNATLWSSDGTAAGTLEIGPGVLWPHNFVRIAQRLWFQGGTSRGPWNAFNTKGLWATNGTAAGTVGLAPDTMFSPSLPGGRPGLVMAGGFEYEVGREPWASNGTPGGTGLLKDLNLLREPPPFPGDSDQPASAEPEHFTPLGTSVLFAANDGLSGREPWITDGTAAGTRILREINPLSASPHGEPVPLGSDPGPFVRLGTRAFFAASDGVSGRELWATDGTTAGTVLVGDLRPGAAGSNPRDLVTVGKRLFFLADGGTSDALWTIATTGTPARVRLLGAGRRASKLVAAGARVFFVVNNAGTGPELWTSDGTRAGTRLVREIRPGTAGSYPQELTAVDGLLLFAADDGVHGLEPWVTDGTAAATRLLADLAPGADASGPANFSVAGDLVGFDADDGVHGREMWGVRKDALTP